MSTDPFKIAYDYLEEHSSEALTFVHDGTAIAIETREGVSTQAILIYSTVLKDEIWVILDPAFVPAGNVGCYYPDEIPLLKNKTPEQLLEIHRAKLVFPGCRIIQD
jgi:hypothetical protein